MGEEAINTLSCTHCDEPIGELIPIYNDDNIFCCHGCEVVFGIINDNGLNDFYKIKEQEGIKSGPAVVSEDEFSYMDSKEFINSSAITKVKSSIQLKLHLSGINCMACLWLIEKTPEFIKGLKACRLNLQSSIVEIEVDLTRAKLSDIATSFSHLGYYPQAIKDKSDEREINQKNDRSDILKIGVAGAALGNIMIFAVSNYAGASGEYREMFNWISALLTMPVILYCATPFYKNSLSSIKMKTVSIDIPLSIAIIMAYAISLYNQYIGSDHLYYDSISALIFLILSSRYLLKVSLRKTTQTSMESSYFKTTGIKVKEKNSYIQKASSEIKNGDHISIDGGQTIQFDGKLLSPMALVSNSILTGESKPIQKRTGDQIKAGSKLISNNLEMNVTAINEHTELGKLLDKLGLSHSKRGKIVSLTDNIAKYFTVLVIGLMLGSFIYYYFTTDFYYALEISLAVTIVACPCALALATPLSFLKSLNILKNKEVFVKNEEALEKVSKIENLILDKTGTLTKGQFGLIHEEVSKKYSLEYIRSLIIGLEAQSYHPIAASLKEHYSKYNHQTVFFDDLRETPGTGISGSFEGEHFRIGKPRRDDLNLQYKDFTQVGLYIGQKNEQLICLCILGDEIKKNAKDFISEVSQYCEVHLATGDHESVAQSVSKKIGIHEHNINAGLSPDDKAMIVDDLSNVMMVGDGANDSIALKKAEVGVSIGGAVDMALDVSDIYLTTPDITKIRDLFVISNETIKLIKRNLIFSISYNFIGIGLALTGHITPLFAAVFMPMSSFTVVISTLIGTKKIREINKGKIWK